MEHCAADALPCLRPDLVPGAGPGAAPVPEGPGSSAAATLATGAETRAKLGGPAVPAVDGAAERGAA